MAKIDITTTDTFTSTHYICDNEHCEGHGKPLMHGWRGNICFVCQGNFCERQACIESIELPGYGRHYICCYCHLLLEDCYKGLEKVENDRSYVMKLWRGGTESPAMKKE